MRYVLTKDFTKINVTAGLFQNLSGDANIEITNDISQQGILLKPFQTVNINATVYARRVSGGGTCALAVLPFAEIATDENSDGETANTENPATDTTSQTSDYYNFPASPPKPPMNPYFGGNIFDGKPGHKPNFPPPPPNFPPKKDEGLTIKIPPEALANGQTKFIVELPDRKKG